MNTSAHLSASRRRPLLAVLFLVAALLASAAAMAQPALAQTTDEDSLVIFDGNAGEYHVKVTQWPSNPVVGSLRIVVEPTVAETGEVVDAALVRVFATPPEEGERQYSPALNSPANRSLYFAQLELDDAGTWTIDVEVDGSLGREIAITQTAIRERARSGDNTAIGMALFGLMGAGFLGSGVWLWYSSKKARARRDEMRRMGHGPTSFG